jgi:hypothetical protein
MAFSGQAQPRRRGSRRLFASVAGITIVALLASATGVAAEPAGLLPDLRAVVPRHVQLVNAGQQEILRFSNSIANTGDGPLAMRPEPPPRDAEVETTAVQELRDSTAIYRCGTQPKQTPDCYSIASEVVTGTYEFHPAHNHWHIGRVALFEIRQGSSAGPIVGSSELKVGFCLVDVINLTSNAPTSQRGFWDCWAGYQGISAGWADQYHQATVGQQLFVTGLPNADDYFLVTTSNPDAVLVESDYGNNSAWVRFSISASSNGNRKITVLENSPCSSPGLCGEYSANRG